MRHSQVLLCAMRRYEGLVYFTVGTMLILLFFGGLELEQVSEEMEGHSRLKSALKHIGATLSGFALTGIFIEMVFLTLLRLKTRYEFQSMLGGGLKPIRTAVIRQTRTVDEHNNQIAKVNAQLVQQGQEIRVLTEAAKRNTSAIETLKNEILSALHHAPDSRFRDAGFTQVASQVDISTVLRQAPADSKICIKNTLINDDGDWWKELEKAVDRGITIQMLIMNPSCKAAKFRAEQLNGNLPVFRQRLAVIRTVSGRPASRSMSSATVGCRVRQADMTSWVRCRSSFKVSVRR